MYLAAGCGAPGNQILIEMHGEGTGAAAPCIPRVSARRDRGAHFLARRLGQPEHGLSPRTRFLSTFTLRNER